MNYLKSHKTQLIVIIKKMKKIIINLALIFCLYGCTNKLYSQTATEIKNKLIGTWILNDNSSGAVKVIFDVNNFQKLYRDNLLTSTETFIITVTCDNETLNNGQFFLKTIDEDGFETCEVIEALSEENGITTLSLSNYRGNLALFTKQP